MKPADTQGNKPYLRRTLINYNSDKSQQVIYDEQRKAYIINPETSHRVSGLEVIINKNSSGGERQDE